MVRHAQTAWNAEGRWQGQSDIPLSEAGIIEAQMLGRMALKLNFDRVISSPLGRAQQTAELGFGHIDAFEPRLSEMNIGKFCGLLYEEVQVRYPESLSSFFKGDDLQIGETGETISEFRMRTRDALHDLVKAHPVENLMVVTHGGVIRSVVADVLGIPDLRNRASPALNVSMTRLHWDGEVFRLASFNEHPSMWSAEDLGEGHERVFDQEDWREHWAPASDRTWHSKTLLESGSRTILRSPQKADEANLSYRLHGMGVRNILKL